MSGTSRLLNSCPARRIFCICACLATTGPNTTSMAATSSATKSCCGNAKPLSEAGRLRSNDILVTYDLSGHLPATTSKDSHRKPANVLQNGSASICRFPCKPKPAYQPKHRSCSLNYSVTELDLWFSKTQTWRMSNLPRVWARREKLSPNCACE